MLIKDRIDYLIDYPEDVSRALNQHSTAIVLDSLAIAGSPDYIVGYVACNKGEEGQRIIQDINKALEKLYHSYEFYLAHTRYLDKTDIANFNLAYQAIFKVDVPKKQA